MGIGGGTSGRALAICLGRPGLNPGTDFGFFQVRIDILKKTYGFIDSDFSS